MTNIIIFGAPGSGKGTYSDEIVKRYGMGHISTGDVLRAEIKAGTELGKTAKQYIDNGQLLPDSLMIDILANTYDSLPKGKGVIFDGFPRTIAQAEALKSMLAERGDEMGRPLRSVSLCIMSRRSLFLHGLRVREYDILSRGRATRI